MGAISAFNKPLGRLTSELSWLQEHFLGAVATASHRQAELACEMTIIRMHDAWARYCRELVILSAYGRTVSLSGAPISPSSISIKNCGMVVPALLASYKSKKIHFEPEWADAAKCIAAAHRLSIANVLTVSAALAAANSPADDLRRVRNFYAHRNKSTAKKALVTRSFISTVRPIVFELAEYTAGGDRIIETWTRGLIAVATAAAQ